MEVATLPRPAGFPESSATPFLSRVGPIEKWRVHRYGAWGLLIGLTGFLLLLPVHFVLPDQFHPVQSLLLYGSFQTFALLYVAWVTLLVVLLTTARSGNTQHWQQLALLSVFAIGFLYYWITFTPWGRLWDEPYQLALVSYTYRLGFLQKFNPNFPYVDWPAVHILAVSLMKVTNLSLLGMRAILALANILVFTGLLYLFFRGCLRQASLASLGVLMVLHGNPVVIKMSFFFPQAFGMTFLLLLLVLLVPYDGERPDRRPRLLLLSGTFIALTATHTISALAFALILSGIFLMAAYWHKPTRVSLNLVLLMGLIWIAWLVQLTFSAFQVAVSALRGISLDANPLYYVFRTAGLKVFVVDYWWAALTRGIWLSLTWLIGPLLWLYGLWRFKMGSWRELLLIGGVFGTLVATIIVAVASSGGLQAFRFQLYGPVFIVPLILAVLRDARPSVRTPLLIGGWLGITLLSLPSFLTFNNSVLFDATYAQEWSAARFVATGQSALAQRSIYVPSTILEGPHYFDSPNARFVRPPTLDRLRNPSEFFEVLERLVARFASLQSDNIPSALLWSRKLPLLGKSAFGIPELDLRWSLMAGRLNALNLVYQDGLATVYR